MLAAPVSVCTLQPIFIKKNNFTGPHKAFPGGLNVASSPHGLGTSSQISVDLNYEDLASLFFSNPASLFKAYFKSPFYGLVYKSPFYGPSFIKSSIFPSNNIISLKHEDFLHQV